jgi:predicted acylesterase/phospholipase RssA
MRSRPSSGARSSAAGWTTSGSSSAGCPSSVVFYDLLANERIVCGNGPCDVPDVPIHEAVTASTAIPGIYTPRRLHAAGRARLCVDGGTGGSTIAVDCAEGLDVLIAYNDAAYSALPDIAHASALAVLGLAVRLLFQQRNATEIADCIDAHPTRHALVFDSVDAGNEHMLSYAGAVRSARQSFDRTKLRLERDYDYLALVLEPRGVRLNPEIAKATFEDVAARGPEVKQELRERHGVAAGAAA